MSETNPKQTFLSERLTEEYERQQTLFSAQPAIVQRFLEAQGKQIAEAVVEVLCRCGSLFQIRSLFHWKRESALHR